MRWVGRILFFIFLVLVFFYVFLFFQPKPAGFSQDIKWGVAFSKLYAIQLGLDWQKTYLAILDDLKVKYLRLPVYWEEVEGQENNFNFSDYDWMIKQAEEKNVKLILVVGYKLPRWPECHKPNWAKPEDVLSYIKEVVSRYKNSSALYEWQVENEPFLPFGICPDYDSSLLPKEISLVRSLDKGHQILTTDSGELGLWLKAADQGDIFGTTMYRVVWNNYLGYVRYNFLLPHQFFWLKANLVRLFHPEKKIIVSELQAEPWANGAVQNLPLSKQFESLDLKQFQININFAKEVGFPEVYLWGAEWWYWLKEKQNDPSFWNYAKELFSNQ